MLSVSDNVASIAPNGILDFNEKTVIIRRVHTEAFSILLNDVVPITSKGNLTMRMLRIEVNIDSRFLTSYRVIGH